MLRQPAPRGARRGRLDDQFQGQWWYATSDRRTGWPVVSLCQMAVAVEDIEDVLARLHAHGAELVGELKQYEDSYRLC
jgi:hypothetical protein